MPKNKDFKKVSWCGEYSYSYCLYARNIYPHCMECEVVKTHGRNNMKVDKDGNVIRRCSCCKEWYPVRLFYKRKIPYKDKIYTIYNSRCKFCTSKINARHAYIKKYGISSTN